MCFPVAGSLPASKTHANRRWTFLASADPTADLGTLTVVQGKRDADSYAVEVADAGRGCSEVLLLKKDATGDLYAVACTRAGVPAACTCPGFQFGRKRGTVCKHVEAVKELLADGLIALPTVATPATPA